MKKLLIAIALLSSTLIACEDEDRYVWNEDDSLHLVRFESLIITPDKVFYRTPGSEYLDEVDVVFFTDGEWRISLKD